MKVTITARSCPSMRRRKDEGNDYGRSCPSMRRTRMKKVTITARSCPSMR
ncbi:hypothetical protein KHA80_02315 [Anaerobacillus sp. HL2]|nr:hypothetical protein KHA80_02315 [Anaerobacillus sp. HL2]